MDNTFNINDKVTHVKTGRNYTITAIPDEMKRLEYCNEPYYEYIGDDGITWPRRQKEMEDGRFRNIAPEIIDKP